ncbi:hypothetical protein DN37_2645 [Vibrio cholerae]|nr:hypothetical protein DN37_2645 [Vibrio cholerae]
MLLLNMSYVKDSLILDVTLINQLKYQYKELNITRLSRCYRIIIYKNTTKRKSILNYYAIHLSIMSAQSCNMAARCSRYSALL